MPTPPEALDELTDILVRLVDCAPGEVESTTTLKSLGVDSLTTVEMADELGRRFGVYLSDATVNGLTTVNDAVRSVVSHDGSTQPAAQKTVAAPLAAAAGDEPSRPESGPLLKRISNHPHRGAALRALGLVAVAGAVIGAVMGMTGAAVVAASGIRDADLPPLTIVTSPEPTVTPEPEPEPEPTAKSDEPKPTLKAAKGRVAPGERFSLTGAIPKLGAGATLQVQVKDPGTGWDDFPVSTTTGDGGEFKTVIYTSRTGDRQFRLKSTNSDAVTPVVDVTIG